MSDQRYEFLASRVGRVISRMGKFFPGSHVVFRGKDLHADLREIDWVELYAFGITGRRFTDDQVAMLHAMWTHTSFPDVRLWNNRVAALAASSRSTPALGMSAALAVSEATIYGANPCVRSIDFLRQARRRTDAGESLDAVVDEELAQRRIYGYGRPIILVDERLPWLRQMARERHCDDGAHYLLAFRIEEILTRRDARLKMNYAALVAALAADFGFTPREFHHFQIPMLLAGMAPCFIEADDEPEGSLLPVPCEDIAYEGCAPRPWPRDA